jgi:alkane 1-monooxygenase
MGVIAMISPWWKSVMNRRVRRWREMYYPEITDWKPYTKASNPLPR